MQRVLDFVGSAFALFLLAPILVCVALILRFTGEKEVLYKQSRIGRYGKVFDVYKFATMLRDSPNLGAGTLTLYEDPRVLPVGRFLRKTKINELPQIANVLAGTMSLIGPRPQSRRCFDAFPEDSKRIIVGVRPGLSGIGSIVFHGENEIMRVRPDRDDADQFYDDIVMPYKGKLEVWYVENRNFWMDCVLLGFTILVMIFPSALKFIWLIFKTLPTPPEELMNEILFPSGKNAKAI